MIYIENHPLDSEYITEFPNGEKKVLIEKIRTLVGNQHCVEFKWAPYERKAHESPDILGELLLISWIKNDLRETTRAHRFYLNVPYLPYSRMDRETGGQLFSLKYLADTINSMNFDVVYLTEAHSKVSLDLIHNSRHMLMSNYILLQALRANIESGEVPRAYVLLPDKGAYARYADSIHSAMSRLKDKLESYKVLVGNKVRDPNTGAIVSYEVLTETGAELPKPTATDADDYTPVYIVDDLCCGGRTFFEASGKLKEYGLKGKVRLCVTHLENAIVDGVYNNSTAENRLEKIYATRSMLRSTWCSLPNLVEFPLESKWTPSVLKDELPPGTKITVGLNDSQSRPGVSFDISGTIEFIRAVEKADSGKCTIIMENDEGRSEVIFNYSVPFIEGTDVVFGKLMTSTEVWATSESFDSCTVRKAVD